MYFKMSTKQFRQKVPNFLRQCIAVAGSWYFLSTLWIPKNSSTVLWLWFCYFDKIINHFIFLKSHPSFTAECSKLFTSSIIATVTAHQMNITMELLYLTHNKTMVAFLFLLCFSVIEEIEYSFISIVRRIRRN